VQQIKPAQLGFSVHYNIAIHTYLLTYLFTVLFLYLLPHLTKSLLIQGILPPEHQNYKLDVVLLNELC